MRCDRCGTTKEYGICPKCDRITIKQMLPSEPQRITVEIRVGSSWHPPLARVDGDQVLERIRTMLTEPACKCRAIGELLAGKDEAETVPTLSETVGTLSAGEVTDA